MAMKKHTRLDLVEGGNIFKQGDYVTLGFIPRDYTGASVDLTNKQIEGSIFNGSTGVIYEGPASFVDGKIFFTIKQVLNDGKFQLEFTVTDAADPEYRTKFPTDDYASELTIKPSADNLDYVGVSMTTVAQLRTEQEQKQQQFELAIVPQVDELKQRVEEGIGAFTEDTEVKDARMDEINLRTFNQKVVAQLAETGEVVQKNYESAFLSQGIKSPKSILVFVDDDGKSETWTKTREIFNRKGKKFVAAVTTGLVGTNGYMTLQQVKDLQSEGHEISSHHVTHRGITDEFLPELRQSKQWFIDNSIICETLTWVGGGYSDNAINEAKKYYKCATSVERGKNTPPVKQYILKRYAVGSMYNNGTAEGILENGSQTQYNAMVDLAKNNNALVIAMMHNWDPAFDATQETRVEAMIDYADAQGVDIMTLSEAMEHFGNLVDIGTDNKGYFRVGANGNVSNSSKIDKLVYKNMGINPLGITNDTLGTAFERGYVNVATFTLATSGGFPESPGGTLETYYLVDQYTIQQKWYPYNSQSIWFRQFNATGNVWYKWQKITVDSVATDAVNIPSNTINANAVRDIQITHPNLANIDGSKDLVMMSPIGGLENNLVYNVHLWTNKTIILRLHNPTATAITTAARNWRIKVLK